MQLSGKQWFFGVGTIIYLLLLLILGDSYINYPLLGFGGVWFLTWWWIAPGKLSVSARLSGNRSMQLIWAVWLAWLVASMVSGFFSISIPLSLERVSYVILAWLVFWTISSLSSWFKPEWWATLLLILALPIVGTSIFFQFFPAVARLLPGMNILYASYGHNHLAALLVLLAPLSWWWTTKYGKPHKRNWVLLIPIFFVVMLLTSFARVATVIGVIQLIFICYALRRQMIWRTVRPILSVLLVLFGFVLVTYAFFSVAHLINPAFTCPLPGWEKRLCKPIEQESRPAYWYQAIQVIKDNIWIGAGPGTFGIANKKYQYRKANQSAYAHNAFLEQAAETGMIGGTIFLLLMSALIFYAWHKNVVGGKNFNWYTAIFIGLVSIYTNALFDFDWSFLGVFILTVFLLSLLCSVDAKRKLTAAKSVISQFQVWLTVIVMHVNVVLLLALALLYVYTNYLIQQGNLLKAWQIFPYFHWQKKVTQQSHALSPVDRQRFFEIYANHPEVYVDELDLVNDAASELKLKKKLIELQPSYSIDHNMLYYYLSQGDWQLSKEQALILQKTWKEIETKGNMQIDHLKKVQLAKQLLKIGDELYLREDVIGAAQLYVAAHQLNEWVLNDHVPVFNRVTLSPEKTVLFFNELRPISTEYFGQYSARYAETYVTALDTISLTSMASINADDITYIANLDSWSKWNDVYHRVVARMTGYYAQTGQYDQLESIGRSTDWAEIDYQLRKQIVSNLQKNIDQIVTLNELDTALRVAALMPLILPNDYWIEMEPAILAMMIPNPTLAEKYYQSCSDHYQQFHGKVHNDCQYGLETMAMPVAVSSDQYWRVSDMVQKQMRTK